MFKLTSLATLALCALLLCSFTIAPMQEDSAATAQPAAEEQDNPSEETVPEPGEEETGERLVPYTMAWLDRYAPASVAPFEEQVGDNGDYEEVTDRPDPDTYKLVVDYHNQCIYAFSKDEKGNFINLERVMICTTGGNGNWTPEGTYNMGETYHRFGFFVNFNCYAQYWSQMHGSFYFHSLLYTSRSGDSYTMSSYNNLGKPGSHGCIRLFVPDARWIYENCAPGTECVVTTDYPKNETLKTALRKGYEGAIDYVAPEEEAGEEA
ncbi:L,D-transpeptidase [Christensenellaceae bacterium OttesenSCG-928-K19]|nr:L,D-transpeptidase [Christensenellaceae bacterium OttesenSCG-928-K19]